jgi:hypothetical protein
VARVDLLRIAMENAVSALSGKVRRAREAVDE